MKRNTAWAFVGNSAYAASQWVVFVLLVKTLRGDEAGAFAYATAVTGPIFVLANLRLRNLLATGVETPRGFSDYLTARLLTTGIALAAACGIGAFVLPQAGSFEVVTIMAVGRACDAISDLCHGLFQRELDMRSPAISLTINGLFSVALVGLTLALFHSLMVATAAYAGGSFIALAAWDVPRARRAAGRALHAGRARTAWSMAPARRLIAMALPLGLSSALGSLQTNLPRYAIAASLGSAMLAKFAAISYVTMVGHLVVNATSQAALPLLARDAHDAAPRYRRRLGGLVAGTIVVGALTAAATFVAGGPVLALIYGPEYSEYAAVLSWLVLATVITFTSVFLGTGTTARRRFVTQCVITTLSLVVVGATAGPLVTRYGLVGAAWALVAGAVVELSAYVVVTVRDMKAPTAVAMPAAPLRVLNVFGRLERGGAELRSVEIAESFPPAAVRSDFVVLTGLDGALDDRVRAAGGDVIKCRLNAAFPYAFYRLLRMRRYDVVHSHVHYFSGVVLTIARLAGVRGRVAHLHTAVVNDRADTSVRRAQLAICRALLDQNATDIVAVGEGTMTGAWRERWGADSRCRVIYSGVRADRLDAARTLRSDEPTIVNVGSIKPLKNQRRLIDIFRRVLDSVPNARLLLIGKEVGDYGRTIREAAADAGLADRVDFVGEVEEPLHWISRAHVMILPSLWEGLPCAVLEACAAGTPAVVSDLPGTREIARYFPRLNVLSLEDADDVWAAAVVRALDGGALDATDAAEWLAGSPFAFARSVEAHFELWSRSHAMA